jgi:hypothetical protein
MYVGWIESLFLHVLSTVIVGTFLFRGSFFTVACIQSLRYPMDYWRALVVVCFFEGDK